MRDWNWNLRGLLRSHSTRRGTRRYLVPVSLYSFFAHFAVGRREAAPLMPSPQIWNLHLTGVLRMVSPLPHILGWSSARGGGWRGAVDVRPVYGPMWERWRGVELLILHSLLVELEKRLLGTVSAVRCLPSLIIPLLRQEVELGVAKPWIQIRL